VGGKANQLVDEPGDIGLSVLPELVWVLGEYNVVVVVSLRSRDCKTGGWNERDDFDSPTPLDCEDGR
jgi:hypothetical protein